MGANHTYSEVEEGLEKKGVDLWVARRYAPSGMLYAAPPAGFYELTVLSQRAAWIAKKPVQAFCATDATVWAQWLAANNDNVSEVEGATPTIGGNVTYVASDVCDVIRARLRKRTVNLRTLGAALEVVTHESLHMRGETDEGRAECEAIRTLPAYLVAKWGFRKNSYAYRQVMYGALDYHKRTPPAYRAIC